MKANPKLNINLYKIKKNSEHIKNLCSQHLVEVVGITKGCSAIPDVAQAMMEGGIEILGDSRIKNIQNLKRAGIKAEMMLVRTPMLSEVPEVIKWADISLNSEIAVIESLSREAWKNDLIHRIVLMIELGDLREGIMPEDILTTVEKIIKLPGIKLMGIGANFGCIGGVMPSPKNMEKLAELAEEIERYCGIVLEVISGGNTSGLKLLEDDLMPKRINQLRIGVGILLGQDDARSRNITGTYQDTFTLSAEVIEIKLKPSLPQGEIGRDAFGEIPVFLDLGLRKRAILALGKQDVDINSLIPIKPGIKIIAASSDHLIIDVTDFKEKITIGDEVEFKLNYPALLSASTSKYINKCFYKEEN